MKLAELRAGQRGVVKLVDGADDVSIRLMEMGLTPGCEVAYLGTAPLGDPLEFSVRGYHLSLRKTEAARVEVELSAE